MSNDDYKSNDSGNGFQNEGIDRFVDDLVQGKLASERDLTSIERALVEISSFSSPDREFGGSSVVEQMSEQIAKVAEHPHLKDKRAIFTRVLGAKALLAATTAVALTGTAAAAASGSLPAPIQQVFASAASNLGVSLPSSPPTTEGPGSSSSQNQVGSAQTQPTTTTTVTSSLALGPTTTVTASKAITKTDTSNCVSGSAQIAYSPDIATSISTGNSNPTSTTSSSTTSSTSSTTTTEPASNIDLFASTSL